MRQVFRCSSFRDRATLQNSLSLSFFLPFFLCQKRCFFLEIADLNTKAIVNLKFISLIIGCACLIRVRILFDIDSLFVIVILNFLLV